MGELLDKGAGKLLVSDELYVDLGLERLDESVWLDYLDLPSGPVVVGVKRDLERVGWWLYLRERPAKLLPVVPELDQVPVVRWTGERFKRV